MNAPRHVSIYELGRQIAARRGGGASSGMTPGGAGLAAGVGVVAAAGLLFLILGGKPGWGR